MCVVNNTVNAVCYPLSHGMVHKVGGEFAGRPASVLQSPDNTVGIALFVDFHNTVLRFQTHILQELSAAGGDKVLTLQVISLYTQLHPWPGFRFKIWAALRHFLLFHAVGQVAAVSLMPALFPAVIAHSDKTLHKLRV